jgi:queuine tRNA-ribosyltransferase
MTELSGFGFEIHCSDPACAARVGTLRTPRGDVDLPAFMPVGTQATIKGLLPDQVHATGTRMILGNTYHLGLRPGSDVVAELGGLHRFMGWSGPILTDSGGFQIFSLAHRTRVSDKEVVFRSHIDGRASDVAMVLDHVISLPAERRLVADAMQRTVRWAQRCREAHRRRDQLLFGIVQGGLDMELRAQCAGELVAMDFDGYAIGGLSVGERPEQMYQILQATIPALPVDRPRYLMGVGRPEDLLEAIHRGVDLFDCVMPTRNGRNGMAFTDAGPFRLRNQQYERDRRPLEPDCPCVACRYSRAYLRHLFMAGEMLGPILLTIHNLTYYQRLLAGARDAIRRGEFDSYRRQKRRGWEPAET